jgi:hypothetical protein
MLTRRISFTILLALISCVAVPGAALAVVAYLGLAAPVKSPQIGPPERP